MFGSGSGPPFLPALPPMSDTDEHGRPLRRPRPGLDAHARWAWLAAAAFAALALALQLGLWRTETPPAWFGALAAVLVAAALWNWQMSWRSAVNGARGALVGSLVGLLTPPAAWALFAAYWLLAGPAPLETLTWIFALASATLALAWIVAVPSAALLGAALGYVEHRRLG